MMGQNYSDICTNCGSNRTAIGDSDLAVTRHCLDCKHTEILVDKKKKRSSGFSYITSSISLADEVEMSPEDFA
jgi:hypothetical protein